MDRATAKLTDEVIASLITEAARATARPAWTYFVQVAGIVGAALLLAHWL